LKYAPDVDPFPLSDHDVAMNLDGTAGGLGDNIGNWQYRALKGK